MDLAPDLTGLLARHPVVDGHNDLLWEARKQVGYDFDRLDVGGHTPSTHTDLPRLAEGGVGGQFWSVYVPTSFEGHAAVTATLEQVDAAHRLVERYADRLALATTADEVEAAWRDGRIASLLGRRGRPLDRLLAGCAADAPPARRPLPDAHPQRQHPVGRLRDRRARRRRAQPVRRRGGPGDEPARHDGRPLPRRRRDDAGGPRRHRGAGRLLTLLGPRGLRPPAQRARRRAGPARRQRRRVHGDLRPRLRECRVRGLDARAPGRRRGGRPRPRSWRPAGRSSARPGPWSTPSRWRPSPTWSPTASTSARSPGSTTSASAATTTAPDRLPDGLQDVTGYPRLLAALAERGWSGDDLSRLTSRNVLRVMRDVESAARTIAATRGPSLATLEQLDGPRPAA